MNSIRKQTYTVKLYIATNRPAQEPIVIENWRFEEQDIGNRKVLVAITEIKRSEADKPIESKALDAIELPLTVLTFCLDGIFRVNPNNMEVTSLEDKSVRRVFMKTGDMRRSQEVFLPMSVYM